MTRARDVANIDGILTTTGDTYYASAAATPARLGIGSTGQVMTVAGGVPSWATASSGSMTLLSTTTLSGATTTVSSISQSYKNLYVEINQQTNASNNGVLRIAPNGNTTSVDQMGQYYENAAGAPVDYFYTGTRLQTALSLNYNFQETRNKSCFTIFDYTSTINPRMISGVFGFYSSSNAATTQSVFASYISTSAITSLVFSNQGGDHTGGTVKIYGVN
jgi:hypothetical protein